MTNEDLEKKAEEYIKTNCIEWKIVNLQFSSVKEIKKAYIAGAKAMQEENEQLKRKIGVMQSCYFNSCIGCNDKKCEVKNEN